MIVSGEKNFMTGDYERIKRLIIKYGLKPASNRSRYRFSFFAASCVALGYVDFLKKFLGFSFRGLCVVGYGAGMNFLTSDAHIKVKMAEFIKKHSRRSLAAVFDKADRLFCKIESGVKKQNSPKALFQYLIKYYPAYFAALGVYNCFWRFVGDDAEKLEPKALNKIIRGREKLARLYSEIEKLVDKSARELSDNGSLKFLTGVEMKKFLENGKIGVGLAELKRRSETFLYFYDGRKEEVIADKKTVKRIHDYFLGVKNKNINKVTGYTAYAGKVRGEVFNLMQEYTGKKANMAGKILVTSMTRPEDIKLVARSKAIVTDEGGVLSHAAIVSRELRIPCVIGAKIATKIFKDGDLVEVDANKGIVRRIKKT